MQAASILIVEDEAIIALEVESNLKEMGYRSLGIVDSGQMAIEMAEKKKPDLILMDIRIKGDMDGIDTAEIIRNQWGIPVVFTTAYLDQERIDRAKITMPFGYLLKPIRERDLKVAVDMALYASKVDNNRREAERRSRFQSYILNSLQQAVIATDLEGNIEYFNKAAEKLYGWTASEVLYRNIMDITVPQMSAKAAEEIMENLSEGQDWEGSFCVQRKDGSTFTAHVIKSPIIDETGKLVGIVGISMEVS